MAKLSSKYRNPSEERPTPYVYNCSDCDEDDELYFSMRDDRPDTYDCPFCGSKNSMKRVFNDKKVHIPFQWGEDKGKSINFDKRPSGKRKLHPVENDIS